MNAGDHQYTGFSQDTHPSVIVGGCPVASRNDINLAPIRRRQHQFRQRRLRQTSKCP